MYVANTEIRLLNKLRGALLQVSIFHLYFRGAYFRAIQWNRKGLKCVCLNRLFQQHTYAHVGKILKYYLNPLADTHKTYTNPFSGARVIFWALLQCCRTYKSSATSVFLGECKEVFVSFAKHWRRVHNSCITVLLNLKCTLIDSSQHSESFKLCYSFMGEPQQAICNCMLSLLQTKNSTPAGQKNSTRRVCFACP